MIRKITRGTTSTNGSKTIKCSITDTSKVIVILDIAPVFKSSSYSGNNTEAILFNPSVYLKSVSTTGITVEGSSQTIENTLQGYFSDFTSATITFSYQIIEFM